MNAKPYLDELDDRVIFGGGTKRLRKWLDENGMTLSLLDLDAERRRRRQAR